MTLSIMNVSRMNLFVTPSISDTQNIDNQHDGYLMPSDIMLSVNMLRVMFFIIMLSLTMLNANMLCVIMLKVMAPQ